MLKTLLKVVTSALALTGANIALAVPVDVSTATAQIGTDGTAAVTAVGAVIIALAALSMVFRWIKGAIFS